jgi:peptidoglycan hydrolase FlgJ
MTLSISSNTTQRNTLQPQTDTGKTARDLKSLRESCREFEAIFIDQMYKTMRQSMPDNGLMPRDNATKMYQDMLDMQMARETAKGKGIGIGEAMYNQMKVHVEGKK